MNKFIFIFVQAFIHTHICIAPMNVSFYIYE